MLYTNGKVLLGVKGGANKTAVALPLVRSRIQSNYRKALISDGYGFENGNIKGPARDLSINISQYTQDNFNDWIILTGAIPFTSGTPNTTNYYLTQDITISSSAFLDEGNIFDGILDGCGHTITINCSQSSAWSGAHSWGTLFGVLRGTLRNVKIVTNFFWENTNSNGNNQYVGGVAGRIIGGTVQNVYIQVGLYSGQTYSMRYTGRPTNNAVKMVGGCFGEAGDSQNSNPSNTCSLTNVTIQIDGIGWQNTAGGNVFGYPDVRFGIGGCVGHIAQNTMFIMKNISIKGSGNLASATVNSNSGGKSKSHKGGLVAHSEGMFSLTNCKYSYSGTVTTSESLDIYYECSVGGAASSSNNFSISNFYYTSNSYAAANGYLEWQDTRTALFGQQYDSNIDSYIGFEGDDLWIGDMSELQFRTMTSVVSTVQGKYLDSIVFEENGTESVVDVSELLAKPSFSAYCIIKIAASTLQSMTNILKGFNIGYYGYLSNETGSSANSFKLYYNNGSYTDHSMEQGFNGRVSVYDVYKRVVKTINSSNVYIYTTQNTNIGFYTS